MLKIIILYKYCLQIRPPWAPLRPSFAQTALLYSVPFQHYHKSHTFLTYMYSVLPCYLIQCTYFGSTLSQESHLPHLQCTVYYPVTSYSVHTLGQHYHKSHTSPHPHLQCTTHSVCTLGQHYLYHKQDKQLLLHLAKDPIIV